MATFLAAAASRYIFRAMAPTDSEGSRPLIPRDSAHRFRGITPADSDGLRPLIPRDRAHLWVAGVGGA